MWTHILKSVASTALIAWRTTRADRMRQLYDAHSAVEGGDARGRRWRTGQINRLLVIALAAEFQGYVRDLHDLVVDEFVNRTEFLGYDMAPFMRSLLTQNRRIDRGNPGVQELAEDFGRFGIDLWPSLKGHHTFTSTRQDQLGRVMAARNSIAHADTERLAELDAEGYPMTLRTVTTWQSALSGLAETMDRVLGYHVMAVYGGGAPW